MMASSLCFSSLSPLFRTKLTFQTHFLNLNPVRSSSSSISSSFTWDDVLRVSQQSDSSPNLQGFFERFRTCNRGSELKSEFLPFVIEERIAGYVHTQFADHLREFEDVFAFPREDLFGGNGSSYVTLHGALKSVEERTKAVGVVINCLRGMIPGIRNEVLKIGIGTLGACPTFRDAMT
ncbi:hypothetical protein GIB67_035476 [Kingdonia uniflora]|uniref:DUF4743 domain-containing protein n=1 Tax=Kingdonia uniflora TaxID=39325 RepID=A0A7J7P108_9MAGN|nr:hypothetical protein GIB67_035476 [Kingdonia uniflora]